MTSEQVASNPIPLTWEGGIPLRLRTSLDARVMQDHTNALGLGGSKDKEWLLTLS